MQKLQRKDIPTIRQKLLRRQRGICPICGQKVKDPVLDHDHQTEAVRDTLCRNCNRVEGKVLHWVRTIPGENVSILRSLAKYWIRHKANRHGLLHPGAPKRRRKRKRRK